MRDPDERKTPRSTPRTLLIVDDDATVYCSVARALRRRGWRSEHARSVAEARALLSRNFDAILIDLNLGDGGRGEDVLVLLDARPAAIATVVWSGCGKQEGANAIGLEGVPYLEKPPTFETLLATLDEEIELTRRIVARGLCGLVARTERGLLRAMWGKLRATGGNQSEAALALGLPRTTLRDKMELYGLESAAFRRPKI